ncbi:putative adenylate kinase [Rosa chinensis]|uniref:adenylate kinase n=1 Tax=Rosa chinensis TaxID=74649 RepID=A0A2P6QWN0_ROSCH|nr:putative adenylate kinase [Rosa chinensis]
MDSSRISLRPFKLSDADDFLKWASDDRVTRYLRWNTITSGEEALTYIEKVCIPHPRRQSICLDDHCIGYVSVKPERGYDSCRAHGLKLSCSLKEPPLKVMISGAPTSGKGTQCELIVKKFGLVHISTTDLLRAEVSSGTEIGNKAKGFMHNGKLVPDEIVTARAIGVESEIGIVTLALKMAISRVFKEFLFLVRIEALVEVENKGSQRVLEKVGFVKEGLKEVWALQR